jgi:hypothetical protein
MTTHGTDERCAIRLRLLLQGLFQSPCLSGDDEERVGHEFRDGTSCTQNVLGFPTSLDLAGIAGIAGDTLGCRRTPWRRCPGWD